MSGKTSLGRLLVSFLEVVLWMAALVCLAIVVNFLVAMAYLEPVLGWDLPKTVVAAHILEGMILIFMGIRFTETRIIQSRAHYVPNVDHPFHRVEAREEIREAKPRLGVVLIGTGIALFIIGFVLIPTYVGL